LSKAGFNQVESRAVISLSSLYLVRMLGLFMALPVLSLYADDYRQSTPFLIGVAIGIYGLSQAFLQLPLGLLSDRIGRRPVIIGGLLMLTAGSVVAATADSIYGLIAGRFMQGAGAIASAMMALLADLTRESNRTKAMAAVGASIGLSFMLSLVIGPWLTDNTGISGLFMFTAALAVIGLLIALFVVPVPVDDAEPHGRAPVLSLVGEVLRDPRLVRLDIGVFALHLIITALFVVVPLILLERLGIARQQHGWVYLGLLGLSFVGMIPMLVLAERRRIVKPVFVSAIALTAVALLALSSVTQNLYGFLACLFVFFVGFNYLEASLPSLVSRAASRASRGTASGVYSSAQFLGAFCGGAGGGYVYQEFGVQAVFVACGLIAIAWTIVALAMPGPVYLRTITLMLDDPQSSGNMSQRLRALPGVCDVLIIAGAAEATLQVDDHSFDDAVLDDLPVQVA